MWDTRYSEDGYIYGTAPNDFLAASVGHLTSPVLCLAAGEGRNAVWLAEQGLEVHAVDGSAVGVAKTLALAAERGVTVHATHADLATFDLGEEKWGGITAIFAHLPPPLRARVHGAIARALAPGGRLVLEAYAPRQLEYKTGGPPVLPMLFDPPVVRAELGELIFHRCEEVVRSVVEGKYHTGDAAVCQIIAERPS